MCNNINNIFYLCVNYSIPAFVVCAVYTYAFMCIMCVLICSLKPLLSCNDADLNSHARLFTISLFLSFTSLCLSHVRTYGDCCKRFCFSFLPSFFVISPHLANYFTFTLKMPPNKRVAFNFDKYVEKTVFPLWRANNCGRRYVKISHHYYLSSSSSFLGWIH